MIAAKARGRSAVSDLKKLCPQVYRQLAQVPHQNLLLTLWGQSTNFDEIAREQIVHPSILSTIGEIAGTDMSGESVHAGLQHTYGYLFSLVKTPYGFKRERWLETGLERSLGLDRSLFGPAPRAGSLLANLTYFLGRIAFKGQRREIDKLRRCVPWVASSVVEFNYRKLIRRRISETVSIRKGRSSRPVSNFTDLITLPDPHGKTVHHWLVYSTADQAQPNAHLITAFNITDDAAEALLSQKQGARVDVPLRYNVYLPGATQSTLRGRRTVGD